MKVLITGVTGLVGSELFNVMSKNKTLEVFGLSRESSSVNSNLFLGELNDFESLENAFEGIDTVIHTAAFISFNKKDKIKMMQTNVDGTTNVVNACLQMGVKHLIFISSVAAIGRPHEALDSVNPVVVDENFKWVESPLNSNYAKSKYEAELEVWRGEAEGLNVAVVNPSIILGEGNINRSSTRLFEYVKRSPLFYPNGYINYVDLNDVTNAIEKILEIGYYGDRFILNGGNTTYAQLFGKMASVMGKKAPKIKLSNWAIEVMWRIEWIRSLLTGSNPLVTKETAITTRTNVFYDAHKAEEKLGITFTPLNQTIERVGSYIVDKYS